MSGTQATSGATSGDPAVQSLYQRLGGAGAVDAAVELFYRKVLRDPRTARFFDGVDMDAQIAKQAAFLTVAFGGPNNYTGQDLRAAHAHLLDRGMGEEQVDAVIELLGATLVELGVSPIDIAEVAAVAGSVRGDVLSR
ncbi:MAG TPA: group 1 truncated hemoglobin [Mycobacteriales bacterium]|nr:group 1 truncated hemoglobin [Mycobacteriales bacterium]